LLDRPCGGSGGEDLMMAITPSRSDVPVSQDEKAPVDSLPEPDSGPTPILVDELDAGGLKSAPNHIDRRAARLTCV
jgi:hypothetical protein